MRTQNLLQFVKSRVSAYHPSGTVRDPEAEAHYKAERSREIIRRAQQAKMPWWRRAWAAVKGWFS